MGVVALTITLKSAENHRSCLIDVYYLKNYYLTADFHLISYFSLPGNLTSKAPQDLPDSQTRKVPSSVSEKRGFGSLPVKNFLGSSLCIYMYISMYDNTVQEPTWRGIFFVNQLRFQ